MKEKDSILIKEVDGIPCIVLDGPQTPSRKFAIFGDFTSIQDEKTRNFLEDCIKEMEKLFKGWGI